MHRFRPFALYFCCLFVSCSGAISSKVTIERKGLKERTLTKIDNSFALYEMGEIDAAIANLVSLVDHSHYSQAHDKAYELLVTWLLQTNRYEEAKRYGSRFLLSQPKAKSADYIVKLFAECNIDKKLASPIAVLDIATENNHENQQDIELDGLLITKD